MKKGFFSQANKASKAAPAATPAAAPAPSAAAAAPKPRAESGSEAGPSGSAVTAAEAKSVRYVLAKADGTLAEMTSTHADIQKLCHERSYLPSSVAKRLGVPVVLSPAQGSIAYGPLVDPGSRGNQLATYLAIDTATGFAAGE